MGSRVRGTGRGRRGWGMDLPGPSCCPGSRELESGASAEHTRALPGGLQAVWVCTREAEGPEGHSPQPHTHTRLLTKGAAGSVGCEPRAGAQVTEAPGNRFPSNRWQLRGAYVRPPPLCPALGRPLTRRHQLPGTPGGTQRTPTSQISHSPVPQACGTESAGPHVASKPSASANLLGPRVPVASCPRPCVCHSLPPQHREHNSLSRTSRRPSGPCLQEAFRSC